MFGRIVTPGRIVYATILAGIAIAWVAAIFPPGFLPSYVEISCTDEQNAAGEYCGTHHVIPVILHYILEFLKTYSDALIAVGTLAIAGFTFTLWHATTRLSRDSAEQIKVAMKSANAALKGADAAKRAADVAQDTLIATDRAWITIDADVVGPLVFGPDKIEIRIGCTFTNIGRAPASNVSWFCDLHPHGISAAQKVADNAATETRLRVIHPLTFGRVLFPGKSNYQEISIDMPIVDFKAGIAEVAKEVPSDPITTDRPAISVGVRYTLPTDRKYRFTILPFEIRMRNDPTHTGWNGDEIEVPAELLILAEVPFSGQIR